MNRRIKGDIQMVEQKWTRFASTGSIEDYLSYKCCHGMEGMGGDATRALMAGREYRNGGMERNGAEHNADGHGAFGSPGGRI